MLWVLQDVPITVNVPGAVPSSLGGLPGALVVPWFLYYIKLALLAVLDWPG